MTYTLPPFPTQLDSTGLFPYPEGEQWEYKASTLETTKLHKTICSFLNARGGYIVVGITDNLRCVGVNKDAKKYDTLALSIDNIRHYSAIVDESCGKISLETQIKLEQKELAGKTLLVVSIVPEPGKRYKLMNGEFWVRLNASNYCVCESKLYEKHTVLNLIAQKEADITARAADAEKRLVHSYTTMLRSVREDLSEYHKEVRILRSLLENKILQEKRQKEEKMRAEPSLILWVWKRLVAGCFQ